MNALRSISMRSLLYRTGMRLRRSRPGFNAKKRATQPSARPVRLTEYPDYLGMDRPAPPSADLLHGTLDTLVLRTLAGGRRHGYGIARAIEGATDGVVAVEEGSLYPALYRMERKGWIDAEWGTSELGRRAKFYRLTARGRKQ